MKPSRKSAPRRVATQTVPAPATPRSEIGNPNSETILLAVTGMSPAVLTETVWALAHPADGAAPVIPDRVVVITTVAGRQAIERELHSPVPPAAETHRAGPTVWDRLRAALLGPAAATDPRLILQPPRVMEAPDSRAGQTRWLDDLVSPADHEAAADFILDEVRRITFNDDTRLIASLAGGRKTMGALLYAALSLLGRAQDRLTHVLVNEPFDHPGLLPKFYFPHPLTTLHRLEARAGRVTEHPARTARLQLADVPFVRLRRLFPQQLGRWPGRFGDLVRHYSEQIDQLAGPPSVTLDHAKLSARINDTVVPLTGREFVLFAFLAERCRAGQPAYGKQNEALADFAAWLKQWGNRFGAFTAQRGVADSWERPDDDGLRRQLSELRKKFRAAGLARSEAQLLPTRGAFGVTVRLRH